MPHLPCDRKDVTAVIVFQDKCPTVPLQLFLDLSRPATVYKKMTGNLLINSRTWAFRYVSYQNVDTSPIETRIELGAPKPSHCIPQDGHKTCINCYHASSYKFYWHSMAISLRIMYIWTLLCNSVYPAMYYSMPFHALVQCGMYSLVSCHGAVFLPLAMWSM